MIPIYKTYIMFYILISIDVLYVMWHCHCTFLYFFHQGFLQLCDILNGYFQVLGKSDLWLISEAPSVVFFFPGV